MIGLIAGIFFSLQPALGQTPRIEAAIAKCKSANVPPPKSFSIDELERSFAEARQRKIEACREADAAIMAYEDKVKAFKYAFENIDSDIAATFARADRAVGAELDLIDNSRQKLWSVPNVYTDRNNEEIRKSIDSFRISDERIADISEKWDSFFAPQRGGSIDILLNLARDEEFSEEAKESIEDYFTKVPPYLQRKAPAPREKLEFLNQQSKLGKGSIELKKEIYGRELKKNADSSLQQNIAASLLEAKAKSVRRKVLATFWNRSLSWANSGVQAGACAFAKQVIENQISTLEKAITLVPEMSETMSATLKDDIVGRKEFVARTTCAPDMDREKLATSLSRWVRIIPSLCANSSKETALEINLLVADMNSWLSDLKSKENRGLIDLMAQKFWSDGYDLVTTCQRGGR